MIHGAGIVLGDAGCEQHARARTSGTGTFRSSHFAYATLTAEMRSNPVQHAEIIDTWFAHPHENGPPDRFLIFGNPSERMAEATPCARPSAKKDYHHAPVNSGV